MDDEIITKYTDNISGLYEYTKANNIPFLYVMAPQKGYGFDYPAGTENYIKDKNKYHIEYLLLSQKGKKLTPEAIENIVRFYENLSRERKNKETGSKAKKFTMTQELRNIGEVVRKIPEDKIIEELEQEILKMVNE